MQSDQRSPLGLGPLETAIMQVMWEADGWLMVRDIRDRMDYAPVAYTTVSKVTSILCGQRPAHPPPRGPCGQAWPSGLVVPGGPLDERAHRGADRPVNGLQPRP